MNDPREVGESIARPADAGAGPPAGATLEQLTEAVQVAAATLAGATHAHGLRMRAVVYSATA